MAFPQLLLRFEGIFGYPLAERRDLRAALKTLHDGNFDDEGVFYDFFDKNIRWRAEFHPADPPGEETLSDELEDNGQSVARHLAGLVSFATVANDVVDHPTLGRASLCGEFFADLNERTDGLDAPVYYFGACPPYPRWWLFEKPTQANDFENGLAECGRKRGEERRALVLRLAEQYPRARRWFGNSFVRYDMPLEERTEGFPDAGAERLMAAYDAFCPIGRVLVERGYDKRPAVLASTDARAALAVCEKAPDYTPNLLLRLLALALSGDLAGAAKAARRVLVASAGVPLTRRWAKMIVDGSGPFGDGKPPPDEVKAAVAAKPKRAPREPDPKRERAKLLAKAKAGSKTAQRKLGDLYYRGDGDVEKNPVTAYRWYLRAAKAGDAEAQSNVAFFLERGEAGRTDLREALRWYEKAAKKASQEYARNSVERVRAILTAPPPKPAPKTRDDERSRILERIREVGLGHVEEAIAALLADSIRLLPRACDGGDLPVGTTKLGGAPDLPPETPWPSRGERPLAFLAQLDLASVAHLAPSGSLPARGLLSFFYDTIEEPWGRGPGEADGWRVLHTELAASRLRRTEPPATLQPVEKWHRVRFRPCAVKLQRELTLPFIRTSQVTGLGLGLDDREKYSDLVGRLGELRPGSPRERHRILGWPDAIQGDMQWRVELATRGLKAPPVPPDPELERATLEWTLLLQLDTDDVPGMFWGGNAGTIYYWMRRQDLAAGRFDRAWFQFQTS